MPLVRDPVIAVLGQSPHRVVLLDARSLEPRGAVKLRSQSIGMTVVGDTIVTAQCGGVADDSDTRVGFLRPREGKIDYLDLGVLDPEEVWATSQGWCLSLCGFIDASGMALRRIDVDGGSFESLSLPPAGQAGTGTDEYVWVLRKGVSGEQDLAADEFYVYAESGEPRVVPGDSQDTVDLCGFGDSVVTIADAGGAARLVRRDAASGEALAERRLPDLTVGPGCAWSVGEALVIGNYENGEGRAVREVVIVDPVTLSEKFRVEVDGLGCVGPAGEGRFVVCEADGDVLVYRASDGRMLACTAIQGRQEELLEVFYIGADRSSS